MAKLYSDVGVFSVDIAQQDFSKERVAEILAAKAQEIEDIKALQV